MLRANRTVRLDLDKGCCETLRYVTIHHKRIDLDEGWCETLNYTTIHHKRIDNEVVGKGSGEEGKWWRCELHECFMGFVLGRKPEHETLCFSV